MKSQRAPASDSEYLTELRRREALIAAQPSAEAYLALADEYHVVGLSKESDRVMQLAEALENGDGPQPSSAVEGLLCGTANPVMLVEVIQILSRTRLSGEFIVEGPGQVFRIYFDNGRVINAASQKHDEGTESFRMALRVPRGTYRFVQRTVEDVSPLIQEPTEILILNIMGDDDKNDANAFIR